MVPSAFHKMSIGLVCAVALLAASAVIGDTPENGGNADANGANVPQAEGDATPSATSENAKLRHEVELLRKENQSLRRQLVLLKTRRDGGQDIKPDEPGDGKSGVDAGNDSEGLKYSISTNRIRHNSSCRHYNPAPEKACGKEDGRPCKACGG